MMKNYATIDDSNICIGVSQLNAEVSDSNLIEIEKYDEDYMWRKYENGVWSEEKFLPTEPIQPPDEIEVLKKQINLLQAQVNVSAETMEFQEELIVELANIVYA